jgi:phage gpG-like protein
VSAGGVRVVIEVGSLAAASALVSRFAHLDEAALLTTIGPVGESQTRRRIEEEKTAPDGTPWPPNKAGTSILLQTGRHLRDSIAHNVSAPDVEWGSSWEFAHVHQNGATIVPKGAEALSFEIGGRRVHAKRVTIPPRAFVGLSDDNGREIEEVTTNFLRSLR